MSAAVEADIFAGVEDEAGDIVAQVADKSTSQIVSLTRMLENNIRVMRAEVTRITHEVKGATAKIKENQEKIKLNTQLPYLVGNVVEVLDLEDEDEEGTIVHSKGVVLKTSTRQTVFLPVPGLVDPLEMTPSDLVGASKDSYLIFEKLPTEYDSRVKAMELDEKPTEDYADVGGLDKQIEELIGAVVLPITHRDRFVALGIAPPKGVLMYGPPGTGKTLMARACAAKTNACFLKIAAPQLVQMFIGDGAKLVRDAFTLAREKAPAIIFVWSTLSYLCLTLISRLTKSMLLELSGSTRTSRETERSRELCLSSSTSSMDSLATTGSRSLPRRIALIF